MSIEHYTISVRRSVERGLVPKFDAAINARATHLTYSLSTEGGYLGAEIGMASDAPGWVVGELPEPMDIDWHDDITIRRGSLTVFEGYVVDLEDGDGGLVTGVILEGYFNALNRNWSRDISTSDITSGEMLERVIAAVAPDIRTGNSEQWIDPLVMHEETLVQIGVDVFGTPVYGNRGGMYDVYKLTAAEAVNLVLTEGDAAKQPLVFMILANMTAHLFPLVLRDLRPDYTTAFDPSRMTWRRSARPMVSHIQVEYQVEIYVENESPIRLDMTTEAETSGFLDAHGFEMHQLLPAGTMTPSGAIALRDTNLTRGSQVQVQATITATADETTWLTRGMSLWPYYAVLPGQWVAVAGRGTQPIVAVTVDASAESATYEVGSASPFMPKNMFIKERNARKRMERVLNLVSGSRER